MLRQLCENWLLMSTNWKKKTTSINFHAIRCELVHAAFCLRLVINLNLSNEYFVGRVRHGANMFEILLLRLEKSWSLWTKQMTCLWCKHIELSSSIHGKLKLSAWQLSLFVQRILIRTIFNCGNNKKILFLFNFSFFRLFPLRVLTYCGGDIHDYLIHSNSSAIPFIVATTFYDGGRPEELGSSQIRTDWSSQVITHVSIAFVFLPYNSFP